MHIRDDLTDFNDLDIQSEQTFDFIHDIILRQLIRNHILWNTQFLIS